MSVTRICLVRHGETDWNAQRRIQGQIDIPLNATGHAQARALARALRGQRFAAAYTSDLGRARATAEPVARALGLPLRHTPRWRERHYGAFQAQTYDEIRQRDPAAHRRLVARDPHFDLEGGESLHAFARRVTESLDALAGEHAGETVVVFTHGGVLDVAHRHASGRRLESARDFDIPNAGLNWLQRAAGAWSVVAWADTRHLRVALDELPG